MNPGCPPNYEEEQSQGQTERHQKIRHIREGDVIAIPSGVPYWTYNNGESPLIAITLLDTSNHQNQLDRNPRRFYLAGNPEEEHPETQEQNPIWSRKHPQQEQENEGNNVFSGFDTQFLAQALNIDEETARQLQAPRDRRNAIVRVPEGLSIMSPQDEEQEWQQQQQEEDEPRRHPRQQRQEGEEEEEQEEEREPRRQSERERRRQGQQGQSQSESGNALVTTWCSLRLKRNIGNPQRADLYNPRAGRITTLNSLHLSILRPLRLSAEWVLLYRVTTIHLLIN